MRRTGWVYHPRFLDHDTGLHHPERPERLKSILRGLELSGTLPLLTPLAFEAASDAVLGLNHSADYIGRVQHTCAAMKNYIDSPDSAICPESEEIARLAVGGVLAACDAVVRGEVDNAFCAVRPPGHHARRDRSAGFCLYNNIAIAARHLLVQADVERVAILDWDVHHGDGTQDSFEQDAAVLFISMHEDPRHCYPGSGYANEVGRGPGAGFTLNIPVPSGAGDEVYHRAFAETIAPRLRAFRPSFLLVSNGLDAHADDPLAGVRLSDECFAWMAAQAVSLADELCSGRLVMVLEGGYDLGVLERCVPRQIRVLLAD